MSLNVNGRYKKIAVHNGSTFTQPTRVRIYKNGNWVDFGANDSGNTNPIYVMKNGNPVRATLNKNTTTSTVTRYRGYHQGSIGTTTNQRYCFYNTAGVANTRFYVYIKFIAQGASNLLSFSANGGALSFNLKVDANGRVYYDLYDGMFAGRSWSEELGYISMGFNQGWQTIEIDSNWGSASQLGTKVNGGDYRVKSWHTAWEAQAGGTIGSNNTRIQAVNINTAGGAHTYVPNDSYTETVTNVSWV